VHVILRPPYIAGARRLAQYQPPTSDAASVSDDPVNVGWDSSDESLAKRMCAQDQEQSDGPVDEGWDSFDESLF
jgi:hypothetical protein